MFTRSIFAVALFSALTGAGAPALAANLIPSAVTGITTTGTDGVLDAGDQWDNSLKTASSAWAPVTGAVQPDGTQWNDGSFWWQASQSATPVTWTVNLDHTYNITQITLQADDNDNYLVEYWTGGAWATAYTDFAPGGWGLITTNSPALNIYTDSLRISETAGDGYYAIGHIEAVGTAAPEPSTWAMMLLGFAGLGFAGYRASRKSAAAA